MKPLSSQKMRRQSAGMTLIEMAVVILIIGLISGSIVVTRNVIRSSEVQSILSQSQIYTSAIHNFTVEFQSLPGDMPDVSQHWAVATNGDGNGFINAPAAGNGVASEPYQFWFHLQQAGLLPINVTGTNAGAGIVVEADGNVPAGKVPGAGWFVGFDLASIPESYDVEEGNYFLYGAVPATGIPSGPLLTPDEAYSVDLKADNGEPATGNIIGLYFNGTCSEAESGANGPTNFNARYRVNDTNRSCALAFNGAF